MTAAERREWDAWVAVSALIHKLDPEVGHSEGCDPNGLGCRLFAAVKEWGHAGTALYLERRKPAEDWTGPESAVEALKLIDAAYRLAEKSTPRNLKRAIVAARRPA